jgi:hypothetical protein
MAACFIKLRHIFLLYVRNIIITVLIGCSTNFNMLLANRLGRGRSNRLIMVRFTTFRKKLEILENTKKLARSKIRIKQDYTWKARQMRRHLIPYLKEARNKGHMAVIKVDKLIVNGRLYELKYLKENIKLTSKDKTMFTPGNGIHGQSYPNKAGHHPAGRLPWVGDPPPEALQTAEACPDMRLPGCNIPESLAKFSSMFLTHVSPASLLDGSGRRIRTE